MVHFSLNSGRAVFPPVRVNVSLVGCKKAATNSRFGDTMGSDSEATAAFLSLHVYS